MYNFPENFGELFLNLTTVYAEGAAICWKEITPGLTYIDFTEWKDNSRYKCFLRNLLKKLVYDVSNYFEKTGLKPGDKAAIISESRWEWVVTDFACIINQIVTVPVYTTMSTD